MENTYIYICPKCGHEFEQGEYNYNYDFGNLEFECPECDWKGTEDMVDIDEDEEELSDIPS